MSRLSLGSLACWICEEPTLEQVGDDLVATEPVRRNNVLRRVEHVRCAPLADFARRSVYRTDDPRLGPNRAPKLHVHSSGRGLLCKNDVEPKRRVGTVRDFDGVVKFTKRDDVCAVCARELASQAGRVAARYARFHARLEAAIKPLARSAAHEAAFRS